MLFRSGKRILLYTVLLVLISSCNDKIPSDHVIQTSFRDLAEIKERGKLVAVTDYNSTNYFIYNGEPMGFHFELLEAFASNIGVKLEIRTENDIEKAFAMLNAGDVDIVAMGLTVNSERLSQLTLSDPFLETRQVLVQRKPANWRSLTEDKVNSLLVRDHLDLAGKVIYVQKGSAYIQRLRHIQHEIGDTIYSVELLLQLEAVQSR